MDRRDAVSETARRRAIFKVGLYVVLVFAFSSVFWYLIAAAGDLEPALVVGLMWSPAVAGLITQMVFERSLRGMGWPPGPLRYLLFALLIPLLYCLVIYLPVWFIGPGSILGDGVAFMLVGAALLALPQSIFLGLGEELGWRGVLVPGLYRCTTFTRTALLSGLIWGVWHYPLILVGLYTSGTQTSYALLCFTVSIVGIATMLAWLRLRSGSFWPAVLYHGSHNLLIQGVFDPLTVPAGATLYITTEFGLGLAVVSALLGYLFWRRRGDLQEQKGNDAVG
ncbi:CPBP family intramembrane metalloprotease [Methanofollis aquaemaris]|uniref:CPBP family intramembrane metalloprotease n=1 Tax=Methanofollis aquaemaris TaxID=126734 RepID=A0A8A3S5Q5_9EURY|nr:type II CAAX endopeptidase family protein [Methanofollis aquaemaris]QSZ67392.1 CPBP family intramembrane metalloprotease [Methanofollis aquaemaris]